MDNEELKYLTTDDIEEISSEELAKIQGVEALKMEREKEGFLPENDEFDETPHSSQEIVENNPRRFIIEECLLACQELWSKNIYTFMVSDHFNRGQCWIEIAADNLSEENKEIYQQLSGDDVIKFSYHYGTVNFGVKCVGKEGQLKLLKLAKQFQMQDVPQNEAYISIEDFLMNYYDCYDEYPNPNYVEMKPFWEVELPLNEMKEYLNKYEAWEHSLASLKYLRQFNPNKIPKPLEQLVAEQNMILDNQRIYLSSFHYQKHQNYLASLNEHLKR